MTFEKDLEKYIESYPISMKKLKLLGSYGAIIQIKKKNCLDRKRVEQAFDDLLHEAIERKIPFDDSTLDRISLETINNKKQELLK